ncbi:MAG: LysE family transporter, partial [Desulfovibrio sp.]|uniref:LysE family transporter n=1 Tax=Desulfovibrio sp. TaxID=885 RepID=UPI0025911077
MPFVVFCSFLSYALIAAVTPGPNNILALSSAAAHGLRRSVPLLAGMSAGFLAVMLLCGCAALALARALPGLAAWMIWPGAVYSLWLAWRMVAGGGGRTGTAPARENRWGYGAALRGNS